MQIELIIGTVRKGRLSDKVGAYLLDELNKRQLVEAGILDLKDFDFPIYNEGWDHASAQNAKLTEFQERLISADGLIWLSPEYHGSYTGALKNCIDYFWPEYKRKPVGVVATSTGKHGGLNASTLMQELALSVGAIPIPAKIIVGNLQEHIERGEGIFLPDETIQQQTASFIDELLWLVEKVS